jgi:hypothetical protein
MDKKLVLKKEVILMNDNKTNINCLIMLFAILSKNANKIRLCEI